ncbi:MAG: hypothetical protein ACYTXF_12935 [Nostoc sp.]
MTCTTTVHGAGLNTNGCGKLPNEGNYTFTGLATFQDSSYLGCPCKRFFLDGVDQGNGYIFHPDAYVVSTTCPVSEKQYDCINGACTVNTTYSTPGLYKSLADCQAVCANGGACAAGKQCVDPTTFCPDGKVCIDQGEFSSIEALISKIGSEVC